jgi:hypothetical protein
MPQAHGFAIFTFINSYNISYKLSQQQQRLQQQQHAAIGIAPASCPPPCAAAGLC